jgi:hypothetical protein
MIDLLERADPNAPVVIRGSYGGYEPVRSVATQPLRLNVNDHDGFGPHEEPGEGERPDTTALAILAETSDA